MTHDPVDRDLMLAREATRLRARTLQPAERTRLWARIDAARRDTPAARFRAWWMIGAAATAAVAASALLYLRTGPAIETNSPHVRVGSVRADAVLISAGDRVPVGRRILTAERGARLELSGAQLELSRGAELTLSSPRSIALEQGTIALSAPAISAALALATPELRLSAIVGRLSVSRANQSTRAELEDGEALLTLPDQSERKLHAGEVVVLPPPAAPEQREEEPAQGAISRRVLSELAEHRDTPKPTAHDPTAHDPTAHDPEARVEEARRWVEKDAPRARAIVEDVLEAKPAPELRARATMVLADALRLEGQRERAAETYGLVVLSPVAGAFREEAMLREAQLVAELGRRAEALELLRQADARIGTGLLLPERLALTADLHLQEDRPLDAAAALERAAHDPARALHRARLRVAKSLVDPAPIRARNLLQPVLESSDPELAKEARRILDELPPGEAKNF